MQTIEGLRGERRLRPLFIGGSSRSGTTLLGSMLGSVPGVVTVPEARFKWGLLALIDSSDGSLRLSGAVRQLNQDWKFRLWGLELPDPRLLPPDRVRYADLLGCLALIYGRSVGDPEATVWIDHTPGNVKFVATMADLLTDLKFVHLVRDGRAVAASQLPLDWGPNHVHKAAAEWAAKIGLGLAAAAALGPTRALTVRYEDLVLEPEATLRGLCLFAELDFDHALVEGRGYQASSYDRAQHSLLPGPLDAGRVTAWQKTLSPRQIETFEYVTGDLLRYLGYEPVYGAAAGSPAKLLKWAEVAVGEVRGFVRNRFRRLSRRHRA
jgi:hypothetical protein